MTKFLPIQIPPGVVTNATKTVRSSNWSEVNLVRWIEGKLQPVGGQTQYNYTFASRCKAVHGWYDLIGVYHLAYVCEQHVYVDTGGVLTDITPSGGWAAPPPPGSGGYGDLTYGDSTYGTPRASSDILALTAMPNVWSVDNFGAILLVMSSVDTRLLKWDPVGGGLLTVVTGAPTGRCFVVTQERFVMIFGQRTDGTADGGSLRRFGWCDQENMTNWNFADVVSQAGFLDVEPAGPILTAHAGKNGILFFTNRKAYVSRYVGLPYVYKYDELAEGCAPISPASVISSSGYDLWMGAQGMFSFDGTGVSPIPCLVRNWLLADYDPTYIREQACAIHLGTFSEFWFFFPQKGQKYNTRCIIYNYKEGWWSQGRMARSAGVTSSYTTLPIMCDGTMAYQHELGTSYSTGTPTPWAETFDLNLNGGAKLCTLKQLMPDVDGDMANLAFSFYHKASRSLGSPGIWTDPIPLRTDGYVDARVTGRTLRMKISTINPVINPWTVGQHLADFANRGDR